MPMGYNSAGNFFAEFRPLWDKVAPPRRGFSGTLTPTAFNDHEAKTVEDVITCLQRVKEYIPA
jgi:hypothetical protein